MSAFNNMPLEDTFCLLCHQPADDSAIVSNIIQYPVEQCRLPPARQKWCHESCFGILTTDYDKATCPTWSDLETLAEATVTLYPALPQDERLSSAIGEGLLVLGCVKLPPELLAMVAAEVTDRIALRSLITLGESRRLLEIVRSHGLGYCERVDLSKQIFITTTEYRGVSYVRTLSNNTKTCFEKMVAPSNPQRIILSSDHVGIRHVQLISSDSQFVPNRCSWHEILCLSELESDNGIWFSHNGLFLRDVYLARNIHKRETRTLWNIVPPPRILPDNFCRLSDTTYARLQYAELDDHVKGIVVSCFASKSVALHLYSDNIPDFQRFTNGVKQKFQNKKSKPRFIYFPLNAGEFITQIWVRRLLVLEGMVSNPVLIFRTSMRRIITCGPYVSDHTPFRFHPLLQRGDGRVSGLCHNSLDPLSTYLSDIGVTCRPYIATDDSFSEPPTTVERFFQSRGSPTFSWYRSSAPLTDITSLRVCRDISQPHRPCIGLLLYYSSGVVESLGQFRWDLEISNEICTPIQIQQSRGEKTDHIKCVRGADGTSQEWDQLPTSGTALWWSGPSGDKLEFQL